jgi:CBS domain-containing protein
MRTRDIMTSPVVTVTPDTSLKDVAALLVERQINAVPVVDAGDRLCGIVSEADLLALEAATPGGAAAARMMLRHRLKSVPVVEGDRVVGIVARRDLLRLVARGDDDDIRAELERRLEEQVAALRRLRVEVADGVVTVDPAADPLTRQLLEGLARAVPGVVEIRSGGGPGAPGPPGP